MASSLVSRNVRVVGRRTSVRLEPVMWQALADISAREEISVFDFCSRASAEGVGAHKTSMLQDVEAGRSLETEALIGAILELGQITEIPAPAIEAVYACVKLLNKVMLLEGAGVRVSDAA